MQNDGGRSLGRFVCVRKRADGTDRVLMVVPKRLRPKGWPATIQLPQVGSKHGRLDNTAFCARVMADAERLNQSIEKRRLNDLLTSGSDHSLAKLAELYLRRPKYRALSESRKYRNKRSVLKIVEWEVSRGSVDVTNLTAADVDDFLEIYQLGSATRFDMRSIWNQLFDTAIHHGWMKESPMRKGEWFTPTPQPVRIWRREDVTLYADMAVRMKQPGLAAMIRVMFETGQRCGDMRKLRWGRDFNGEKLNFQQSKTKKRVKIALNPELQRLLRDIRVGDSPYIFNDFDTGKGFTEWALGLRFSEVRHALSVEGEEKLLLRTLRHSCVCYLFGLGLGVDRIAGVTGHLLGRVHQILERYFPDRIGAADDAMRVAWAAQGGNPEEFDGFDAPEPQDWAEDDDRRARYRTPAFTERNFERLVAAKTGQHRLGMSLPRALIAGSS